ncbi:MAG: hypothetical protein HDS03_06470 [Bacteroides sp.]|nr:hypothetical protein [Bacteroides sp.]MDE7441776.1 hypothetical protein [Muribaculaceae bacterium]
MNYYLSIFLLCLFSLVCRGQIVLDDPSLSRNFRAEIKSLDEFCSRFNGIETNPEVKDGNRSDILNLTRLFDYEDILFSKNNTKTDYTIKVEAFCDSVIRNNITIHLSDPDFYAFVKCKVKFEGKARDVNLLLRQEILENDYTRWCIVAVSGLVKAGIVKNPSLTNISPVEHELHFMGLDDVLNNNRTLAFGYRAAEMEINQLSVFLTLLQTNSLTFVGVEDVKFYCFRVPGFVFVVSEKVRDSLNSGWLITELLPASQDKKTEILWNLYTEK